MNAKLFVAAIPLVFAAWGGDIPGEVQNPCDIYPVICVQPQLGPPGAISMASGSGILLGTDTTRAGTFALPWLVSLSDSSTPLTLQFQGNVPGGPLRNLTNFNAIGTNHTTGRYLLLTMTNTGNQTWGAMAVGLSAPPLNLILDGASFGDSHANDGTVCAPAGTPACLDVTPNFSSNRFSKLSVDRVNDVLTFSGGQVNPGQSVNMLFALTIEQYGPGSVTTNFSAGPYLPLLMSVTPSDVPEPGSCMLALSGVLGMAALRFRGRCRSRRER